MVKEASEKMTLKTAIEIVDNFNMWRLGDSEHIAKPFQITEALDVLLQTCKVIENKINLTKNQFQ